MPEITSIYRVFIASPRGFDEERLKFKEIIEEYNTYEACHHKMRFEAVGWDIIASTVARPQEEINKLIRKCDYFILLLHDKWGSSTPTNDKYYSGSHEEIHIASECCGDENLDMRDIALFFKSIPDAQLNDPGPELKKVIQFRKERESKGDILYDTYDEPQSFAMRFRRNLAVWKQNHINKTPKIAKEPLSIIIRQTNASNNINNIIIATADSLNDNLKKARELFSKGKKLDAELLYARLVITFDDPVAMIEYARVLRKMGVNQKASDLLDKALKKAEILNDLETKAYALQQKGKIAEYLGEYEVAKTYYQNAILNHPPYNNNICNAVTLKYLGIVLRKMHNYEQAEIIFNEALTQFKLFNNSDGDYGIATVYFHLGRQYKEKGELNKAEKYYTDSLLLLKNQPNSRDKRSEAQVKSSLATIYRIKGNIIEARALYEEALLVFRAIEDEEAQIGVYGNLGETEIINHKLDNAYECFSRALHLAEKINKPISIAIALNQMGKVKSLLKDYPASEKLLLQSLDIVIGMKNLYSQSVQNRTLGILYRCMDQYDKSLKYLAESIHYGAQIDHKVEIAYTNLEFGYTYFQMQEYDDAIKYAEKAMHFFKQNSLTIKEIETGDLIEKLQKCCVLQ